MTSITANVSEWNTRLGDVGVWRRASDLSSGLAQHVEHLGYGTIWVGGSPPADLRIVEELLDATRAITVATGIVNIWDSEPATVATSFHRLEARHPGRFLLGIGAGHPESAGARANRPFEALESYLDALDAAGVPRERLVLAALGPRVLRLAAQRTAGAHPYLVTPEHTRLARGILGAGPLLVPEQRVVLLSDPESARAVGRPTVHRPYLGLVNYTNNLRRLGFSDADLADAGSDHLIDSLVVHGTDDTIARRLREHLAAGADHVAVQLLSGQPDDAREELAHLADVMSLR
jgi:probable F420-dependent oxidoreductase